MNYVMEIAPAVERAMYIGFANGVVGMALFVSPLGGAVVDWLGFAPLFVFALLCAFLAVVFSLRLEEPRARQEVATGEVSGQEREVGPQSDESAQHGLVR
jgi:MFS family permease